MDRYMIVIPAKNRALLWKCDDGDSMKLETLQQLVGPAVVAASRGEELIGFTKHAADTLLSEWG